MLRLATILVIAVLGGVPRAADSQELMPDVELHGHDAFLLPGADVPAASGGWNPRALRADLEDRLLSMLPGGVIEDVARTFADRTLQLDLSPKRAFLRLRVPL